MWVMFYTLIYSVIINTYLWIHCNFYFSPALLFFIYDVEKSKSESDDPLESIVYFHPTTGSNIGRRISVVGQIVGTALCVKQLLSAPKLITLERGKFALSWSGRFILVLISSLYLFLLKWVIEILTDLQVVGTSQPVPTHVIQNQRDFIHRLMSSKFGELTDFFQMEEQTYEEFKSKIVNFCDSHLQAIGKKWTELACQPILH